MTQSLALTFWNNPVKATAPVYLTRLGSGGETRLALGLALWVPPSTPAGAEIGFAESWALRGAVYLVLGQELSSPHALADGVARLLAPPAALPRLVWIENPNAPFESWRATSITCDPTADPQVLKVRSDSSFPFRNYRIEVPAGTRFAIDPASSSFTFSAFDERLGLARGANVGLSSDRLTVTAAPVRFAAECEGELKTAAEMLDVGLALTRSGGGAPSSLRYPLVDGASATGPVALGLIVTPSALDDRNQSGLRFLNATEIPTHFRARSGPRLRLSATKSFGFAFAEVAGETGTAPAALMLVPAGEAELLPPPPSTGPVELLVGIAGAEYLRLGASGAVAFEPGPAYFAGPGSALGSAYTSSWVRGVARQQESLTYFAQPQGGELFRFAVSTDAALPILSPEEVSAATFSSTTPPFPLFPVSGIDSADVPPARALEVEVVAPTRSAVLRSSSAPLEGEERVHAVTPGGLIAELEGGRWLSLGLAQARGPGRAGNVALENIDGPLRDALLRGQQFLVISSADAASRHLDRFTTLTFDGWTIDVHPRTWVRHDTILILKHAEGSLRDLARSPEAWASAGRFNLSPRATSERLLRIFDQAATRAAADRASAPAGTRIHPDELGAGAFAALVDDPSWQGVLFLDAAVTEWPDDLRGLAAGMDARGLAMHHVGVALTPLEKASADTASSSIFGTLTHASHRVPEATPAGPVDFCVSSLQLELVAGEIARFDAVVDLSLARLFDTPLDRAAPIRLHGAYQRGEAGGRWELTTREETACRFDDAVLDRVAITRASYVATASDSATATGAFVLAGRLTLRDLAPEGGYDLLSWEELGFAGLALALSVPAPTPSRWSWAWQYADLVPVASSVPRAGSLVASMPVTLARWIHTSDAKPTDLGFMAVDVGFDVAPLGPRWDGIVMPLELGSAGAFAADAGLVAELLLAWSPGRERPAVFTGLRLPLSSGASKAIGIQGVAALTIHTLGLRCASAAPGTHQYVLMLNGIRLELLRLSLPSSGSTSLYLFGDERGPAGSLSWYGAYSADEKSDEPDDE